MSYFRILCAALILSLPFGVAADLSAADLPGSTVWYMHADLEQMRSSESGRELYGWIEEEAVADINDEFSIRLGDEVDRVTAFSDTGMGTVVIVEGPLSDELREAIIEFAGEEGDLDQREHGGRTYYHFDDNGSSGHGHGIGSLEEGGYFTFEIAGKLIVASDEERLRALIDTNGYISGSGSHQGALFVLTADKQFVQAGMQTGQFADDGWDSNILRNTEKAALLVSDQAGMIAVEAKLVSADPEMTASIGNIVNGLISLQSFNSEMDPSIAGILRNTRVDVAEKVLSISTVLDPSVVAALLKDKD